MLQCVQLQQMIGSEVQRFARDGASVDVLREQCAALARSEQSLCEELEQVCSAFAGVAR